MGASFEIDPAQLFSVLATLVVLSFFVERALAVAFESRPFVERFARAKGLKEMVSLGVSFGVCWHWHIDAMAAILKSDAGGWGYLLTAAIVAGGSKASIKFFHDVLGAMSGAEAERKALAAPPAPPKE